jgi:uncharacterized protein
MTTSVPQPETLDPMLADKLAALESRLSSLGSAVVAFSGGVDSALLLRVVAGLPSFRYLALTTASATNPEEDTQEAIALAASFGAPHLVVPVDELETPGYAANGPDRCYLCKQTLYPLCLREARERELACVVDGVNTDDLGDYRPGLRAASEMGVLHPLAEAGLSKIDVRALSRHFRLPTAEKPAAPCLASRFPYGTHITHAALDRVARAEGAVRALGFRELRVRFLGEVARVEIARAEHERLTTPVRDAIRRAVRACGFERVEIADEPLRSGSLNDALFQR